MTANRIEETEWHSAPGPGPSFPAGERTLAFGAPWRWRLATGQSPVLFAGDARKAEYRVWLKDGPALLRIEHHGTAPGWHAHRAASPLSPWASPRADLTPQDSRVIAHPAFWHVPQQESLRAQFPLEEMDAATRAAIASLFDEFPEKAVVAPVPFGAAVGLSSRRAFGDRPGFYIGQLGKGSPVFRLEDDGTTIPLLATLGLLPADWTQGILGPHLHFGADSHTLFTPFFPFADLPDRSAAFVAALARLWALAPGAAGMEGPDETAWTPSASFATL
jgi:hypothetical protein